MELICDLIVAYKRIDELEHKVSTLLKTGKQMYNDETLDSLLIQLRSEYSKAKEIEKAVHNHLDGILQEEIKLDVAKNMYQLHVFDEYDSTVANDSDDVKDETAPFKDVERTTPVEPSTEAVKPQKENVFDSGGNVARTAPKTQTDVLRQAGVGFGGDK